MKEYLTVTWRIPDRRRFAANFHHTMRTPLNAICGFSELLEEDETLDREQRESATAIHEAGIELLQLLTDIEEFLQASPSDYHNGMSAAEFGRLLRDIVVTWRVWGCAGLWEPQLHIEVDVKCLRRVLDHLLAHAASKNAAAGLEIQDISPKGGGGVRLRLVDRNPPIPSELQEVIFMPFGLSSPLPTEHYPPFHLALAAHWARLGRMHLQLREVSREGNCYELELPGAVVGSGVRVQA